MKYLRMIYANPETWDTLAEERRDELARMVDEAKGEEESA